MIQEVNEALVNQDLETTVLNSLKQPVQIVAKHVKFLSDQMGVNQFFVEIVSREMKPLTHEDLKIGPTEKCTMPFVQIAV